MTLIYSFPPIAKPNARILLLGSMPGQASLAAQQYYAHPQNAFWRIMGELLHFAPKQDYALRVQALQDAQIAVWDVLHSCIREGSLDSSIQHDSQTANDFAVFFAAHPQIKTVFFNGGKAEASYKKFVLPYVPAALQYVRLPSTSPANASFSYAKKLQAWQQILQTLEK